jgi:GT2 family glycosyltransferase
MNTYTTSIVIPIYRKWHLCERLLASLYNHEAQNIHEVVIVDDHSMDNNVDVGLEMWSKAGLLPIKVLRNDENLGFTLSANRGLRACEKPPASRHITFLISSDVNILRGFIQPAADILLGARRCIVGGKLVVGDAGWNNFNGRIIPYLEGWLLAATSDAWRELDYFDPNYAPYDFEDVDFSTKASRAGYKLVPLNLPFISHIGGASIGYNPQREAITKRNREYFRQKWNI